MKDRPALGLLLNVSFEAKRNPPFAKEGGRDVKKNAAKQPLNRSGRGSSCFKLPLYSSRTVLIIGGLKQLPRLRLLRNGVIFL
jgi:hypothetical protein